MAYDTALFGDGFVPDTFGRALRYFRQRAGLTQVQLGELAGIDQSNISDIETDKVLRPTWETIARIAVALSDRGIAITGRQLDALADQLAMPAVGTDGDTIWAGLSRRAEALPEAIRGQLYLAVSAMLTALEIAARAR